MRSKLAVATFIIGIVNVVFLFTVDFLNELIFRDLGLFNFLVPLCSIAGIALSIWAFVNIAKYDLSGAWFAAFGGAMNVLTILLYFYLASARFVPA
jgi:hypothetical protein